MVVGSSTGEQYDLQQAVQLRMSWNLYAVTKEVGFQEAGDH